MSAEAPQKAYFQTTFPSIYAIANRAPDSISAFEKESRRQNARYIAVDEPAVDSDLEEYNAYYNKKDIGSLGILYTRIQEACKTIFNTANVPTTVEEQNALSLLDFRAKKIMHLETLFSTTLEKAAKEGKRENPSSNTSPSQENGEEETSTPTSGQKRAHATSDQEKTDELSKKQRPANNSSEEAAASQKLILPEIMDLIRKRQFEKITENLSKITSFELWLLKKQLIDYAEQQKDAFFEEGVVPDEETFNAIAGWHDLIDTKILEDSLKTEFFLLNSLKLDELTEFMKTKNYRKEQLDMLQKKAVGKKQIIDLCQFKMPMICSSSLKCLCEGQDQKTAITNASYVTLAFWDYEITQGLKHFESRGSEPHILMLTALQKRVQARKEAMDKELDSLLERKKSQVFLSNQWERILLHPHQYSFPEDGQNPRRYRFNEYYNETSETPAIFFFYALIKLKRFDDFYAYSQIAPIEIVAKAFRNLLMSSHEEGIKEILENAPAGKKGEKLISAIYHMIIASPHIPLEKRAEYLRLIKKREKWLQSLQLSHN